MRAVNSAKRTDIFNGHGEADNLKRPVPPAPLEKPNYLKDPHRTFKKTQVNPTFNGFVEDAEMHKIEQRRFLEATRKRRILDPKVRTIGVDRQVLDEQVDERKRVRQLRANADSWWDLQAIKTDKHMQHLELESAKLRRQQEVDLLHYRKTYQKKQAAAEWDLNDPDIKKKSVPERVSDNDPRCGPASMLRFEGEDLVSADRRKMQQQQVMTWHKEQVDEASLRKYLSDTEQAQRCNREEELYRKVFEIEALQRQSRRQQTLANADINKAYAAQKRAQAEAARKFEVLQNETEIQYALNSGLLTERDAVRSDGKRSEDKGISEGHLRAILNQQALQKDEMRALRIAEAEDKMISSVRAKQMHDMSCVLEKQLYTEKKDLARALVNDNKKLQENKRDENLARGRLYASEVGEQYFARLDAIQCRG